MFALGLITMTALISACGSSATTGSGGGAAASNARQSVKFADCMRHNGVSDFPDPSTTGKLTIDAIANGSSLDTNSPAFTNALSACKTLEPAGFTGTTRTASQQQAALAFAECMRHNGVQDFPDPTANGPLVDTNRIPSAAQPGGMDALHTAMQKCSDDAAAAGVSR